MEDERTLRRYRRLTEDEWSEVEAAWSSGEITLTELSETFDVAVRTLQNRFAARGIIKGAPAGGFNMAIPDAEALAAPTAISDDLEAVAREVRDRTTANAREIEARLMAAVRGLQADPTTRPAAAIRSLVAAASALERLHGIERTALGLDGQEHLVRELPVLRLIDLTAEQIEELQRGPESEEEGDLVEPDAA